MVALLPSPGARAALRRLTAGSGQPMIVVVLRAPVRLHEAAGRRGGERRRLRDRLALAAGKSFANRLDHLPLAREDLVRLRHVLAEL